MGLHRTHLGPACLSIGPIMDSLFGRERSQSTKKLRTRLTLEDHQMSNSSKSALAFSLIWLTWLSDLLSQASFVKWMNHQVFKQWEKHDCWFLILSRLAMVEEIAECGESDTCACTTTNLRQCLHEWQHVSLCMTRSICIVSLQTAWERLMEEAASVGMSRSLWVYMENSFFYFYW